MPNTPPPLDPIQRRDREPIPGSARSERLATQPANAGDQKTGRRRRLDYDERELARTLELLKGLGGIQCTDREAAAALGVAPSTLRDFFTRCPDARDVFDDARLVGQISLRRWQMKSAEGGNAQMQMWLGKQWLGQRDFAPEKPADPGANVPIDIGSLTLSQLKQLAARIRAAFQNQTGAQQLAAPADADPVDREPAGQ